MTNLFKAIDNNFNTILTELTTMINIDTGEKYTELEILKGLKEYLTK